MNEELQLKANEVLLQLLNKATEVGEAAMAEIPLVVQELLTYNFVTSLVGFIVWGILAALSLTILFKYFKPIAQEDHDAGLAFIAFVAIVNLLIYLVFFSTAWLKIWLAPRVYLLEYAASLIK